MGRILKATILFALLSSTGWARVRLENVCTVKGQQEIRLTGMGLVVGLPGTGDGAKNQATVRALKAAMSRMNQPVTEIELKNADNVAVVLIEATIPRGGSRRGQKIDCYVSAILGAKSLRGGRLLSAPLSAAIVKSEVAIGLSGGAISVEDAARPTTGKVLLGVELIQDVALMFVEQNRGPSITLLIDPVRASFWTSSEVARVLNTEFSFETNGKEIARAIDSGSVEVAIPPAYQEKPVEFVAQVLEVGLDVPTTLARIVVNSRTGTVVVTGEVEISPAVVNHKNFTVEVGAPQPSPSAGGGSFINIGDPQSGRQSPQQLTELLKTLNQLRVPTADVIDIIRELHATGKLHAELVDR